MNLINIENITKYFTDTPQKEVEDIIDKALAAWFKKRR